MQPTMDEKIAKLQFATDEAEADLKVCKEALELSERLLYEAKEKYRSQAQHQQQQKKDDNGSSSGSGSSSSSSSSDINNNLEVNDTELPELLETRIRAKNVYETVEARYNTNKRYLYVMIQKQKTNNV
jgi:hypothetical protein